MNKVIESLHTLQTLELERPQKRSEAIALRETIPSEILIRFDKFVVRGKKGVALVQNGICKGCQIQVPIGVVNTLILGANVPTCGNCGRYLCLLPKDALVFQDRNKPEALRVAKAVPPSLRVKPIKPGKKSAARKGVADMTA